MLPGNGLRVNPGGVNAIQFRISRLRPEPGGRQQHDSAVTRTQINQFSVFGQVAKLRVPELGDLAVIVRPKILRKGRQVAVRPVPAPML